MSKNVAQVLATNPVTTIGATDTFYLAANNTTDAAITGANLKAALSPLTTKGDLYTFSTVNTRLAVGATNGQVLQVSSGAATGLAYSTATYPTVATGAGTILRANGTNWVASTATFSDTYTASNLLYSNGANTVTGLATANNGTLVTSNTGVPSILAGPGTTGNIFQSNAAAAPSFSTATYPSTAGTAGSIIISDGTNKITSTSLWPNTVGTAGKILRSDGTTNAYTTSTFADTYSASTILYSNGANTVTGLATANSSVLVTTSAGVPVQSGTLTNGQMIIGSTGATPAVGTISGSGNITVTTGAGTLALSLTGQAAGSFVVETTTSRTFTAFQSVITNNAGLVTVTVPATTAVGDEFEIVGLGAGGWKVQANTGQIINLGSSPTSSAGSLASTNRYDAVKFVCVVANTTFVAQTVIGNLTVA